MRQGRGEEGGGMIQRGKHLYRTALPWIKLILMGEQGGWEQWMIQ